MSLMLRQTAVVLVFYLVTAGVYAGEPLYVPHGAAEMGVAFASNASEGHWSCFHNQALMASQTGMTVSAGMETRFMLPALSSKAVSAVIGSRPAPIGLIVSHYGNTNYYRIFTGLGSAVSLTKSVSLGVQADFISERSAGDYSDASYITFEVGLAADLTSRIRMGLHVFNPLNPVNSVPSSITAGIAWKPSYDFSLSAGCSIVSDEPLSLNCGICWNLINKLVLRSGYMSAPSCFAFGAGYFIGPLQTDIAFLVNNQTGITSSLSFIWRLGKK